MLTPFPFWLLGDTWTSAHLHSPREVLTFHPRPRQFTVDRCLPSPFNFLRYSMPTVWSILDNGNKYCQYVGCTLLPSIHTTYKKCLPPLSAFNNCTNSQTCLSMLTSIDKAYQCLPPLSIVNGRRLPRNASTSRYRNRHNPSTSWYSNRPENVTFPFIPSSILCFCQRLHIPPPLCVPSRKEKREKRKYSSPQPKKRLRKCVSLLFALHSIQKLDRLR